MCTCAPHFEKGASATGCNSIHEPTFSDIVTEMT